MASTRCACSKRQSGDLREEVARERQGALSGGTPQDAQAYRGTLYRARVSTRFSEGGGKLDHRRARGVLLKTFVRENQRRDPGYFWGES